MRRALALFVLALLVACGQSASPDQPERSPGTPEAAAAEANSEENPALHTIVQVSDGVTYQRAGWKGQQAARFGTTLHTGDILDRPSTGEVVLVCADLSTPEVQSGPHGVPCSSTNPLMYDGASALTTLRGETAEPPPLLLSPLPGVLTEIRPEIRWTAPRATRAFTVTLRDEDGELWSTPVAGDTTLAFPDGQALEPGKRYVLSVIDDQGRSSERAPGKHWLTLVAPDAQAQFEAHERRLNSLAISAIARQLLLARLSLQFDRVTEAEALLASMTAASPEPLALLALAEAETRGILYERAIEHYTRAQTLAAAEGDIETEALASWRLGKIYLEGIPNPDLAYTNITRAKDGYTQLLATTEGSAIIDQIDKDLDSIAGK
jgi:hypothetical protein